MILRVTIVMHLRSFSSGGTTNFFNLNLNFELVCGCTVQYSEVLLFRLPNFSGRYILGLAMMTQVDGHHQLCWFVKESNIHLSLHVTQLDDSLSFSSQQLCYVQAHAASVTFSYTFIHLLSVDSPSAIHPLVAHYCTVNYFA